MKELITDIDGVILDWITPFSSWMESKGYPIRNRTDTYDIHKWFNIDKQEIENLIVEFNDSPYLKYLMPYQDTHYWLQEMKLLGYEIHVVTSVGSSKTTKNNRIVNLDTLFGRGFFSSISFCDFHDGKTSILRRWEGSELPWIEDNISNYHEGLSLGLDAHLMSREYNHGWDAKRIYSIREVINNV